MFDNQNDDLLYDLPYCEDEQDIMGKEQERLVRIVYGDPMLYEAAENHGGLPGGRFSTDACGNLTVLRRGARGYRPYTEAQGRSVNELNAILGVSQPQAAALKRLIFG